MDGADRIDVKRRDGYFEPTVSVEPAEATANEVIMHLACVIATAKDHPLRSRRIMANARCFAMKWIEQHREALPAIPARRR